MAITGQSLGELVEYHVRGVCSLLRNTNGILVLPGLVVSVPWKLEIMQMAKVSYYYTGK